MSNRYFATLAKDLSTSPSPPPSPAHTLPRTSNSSHKHHTYSHVFADKQQREQQQHFMSESQIANQCAMGNQQSNRATIHKGHLANLNGSGSAPKSGCPTQEQQQPEPQLIIPLQTQFLHDAKARSPKSKDSDSAPALISPPPSNSQQPSAVTATSTTKSNTNSSVIEWVSAEMFPDTAGAVTTPMSAAIFAATSSSSTATISSSSDSAATASPSSATRSIAAMKSIPSATYVPASTAAAFPTIEEFPAARLPQIPQHPSSVPRMMAQGSTTEPVRAAGLLPPLPKTIATPTVPSKRPLPSPKSRATVRAEARHAPQDLVVDLTMSSDDESDAYALPKAKKAKTTGIGAGIGAGKLQREGSSSNSHVDIICPVTRRGGEEEEAVSTSEMKMSKGEELTKREQEQQGRANHVTVKVSNEIGMDSVTPEGSKNGNSHIEKYAYHTAIRRKSADDIDKKEWDKISKRKEKEEKSKTKEKKKLFRTSPSLPTTALPTIAENNPLASILFSTSVSVEDKDKAEFLGLNAHAQPLPPVSAAEPATSAPSPSTFRNTTTTTSVQSHSLYDKLPSNSSDAFISFFFDDEGYGSFPSHHQPDTSSPSFSEDIVPENEDKLLESLTKFSSMGGVVASLDKNKGDGKEQSEGKRAGAGSIHQGKQSSKEPEADLEEEAEREALRMRSQQNMAESARRRAAASAARKQNQNHSIRTSEDGASGGDGSSTDVCLSVELLEDTSPSVPITTTPTVPTYTTLTNSSTTTREPTPPSTIRRPHLDSAFADILVRGRNDADDLFDDDVTDSTSDSESRTREALLDIAEKHAKSKSGDRNGDDSRRVPVTQRSSSSALTIDSSLMKGGADARVVGLDRNEASIQHLLQQRTSTVRGEAPTTDSGERDIDVYDLDAGRRRLHQLSKLSKKQQHRRGIQSSPPLVVQRHLISATATDAKPKAVSGSQQAENVNAHHHHHQETSSSSVSTFPSQQNPNDIATTLSREPLTCRDGSSSSVLALLAGRMNKNNSTEESPATAPAFKPRQCPSDPADNVPKITEDKLAHLLPSERTVVEEHELLKRRIQDLNAVKATMMAMAMLQCKCKTGRSATEILETHLQALQRFISKLVHPGRDTILDFHDRKKVSRIKHYIKYRMPVDEEGLVLDQEQLHAAAINIFGKDILRQIEEGLDVTRRRESELGAQRTSITKRMSQRKYELKRRSGRRSVANGRKTPSEVRGPIFDVDGLGLAPSLTRDWSHQKKVQFAREENEIQKLKAALKQYKSNDNTTEERSGSLGGILTGKDHVGNTAYVENNSHATKDTDFTESEEDEGEEYAGWWAGLKEVDPDRPLMGETPKGIERAENSEGDSGEDDNEDEDEYEIPQERDDEFEGERVSEDSQSSARSETQAKSTVLQCQAPDRDLLRQMQRRQQRRELDDWSEDEQEIYKYHVKAEHFNISTSTDNDIHLLGTFLSKEDAEQKVRDYILCTRPPANMIQEMKIESSWTDGIFSQRMICNEEAGCRAYIEPELVPANQYFDLKYKKALLPRNSYAVFFGLRTRKGDESENDITAPTNDNIRLFTTRALANKYAKEILLEWFKKHCNEPTPENRGLLAMTRQDLWGYIRELEEEEKGLFDREGGIEKKNSDGGGGEIETVRVWVKEIVVKGPSN